MLKNCFAVFKNQKLIFFQNIDEDINVDELLLHLKSTFLLLDLKIVSSINIDKKSTCSFIKPNATNLFRVFLFYLLTLFLAFILSMGFSKNKIEDDEIKKLKSDYMTLKNNIEYSFITPAILEVYLKAKEENIYISSLSYENSMVFLEVESSKKDFIFHFLDGFDSSIEDINFNKNNKKFTANASFKIYRR